MRLKSIKVAGFKSFVDPTTIQFPRARSAIVGPNGCGKSNVIDAIRWVMGESSARQLRGDAMSDVIFAGTTKRKPVGMASVELLFENTLGKLGGAYNHYTELAVKRQVMRDGKSDYFINGTRCRRRDITDIFLGTGLGPRSYAVIEQGMVSRLVEAKPDELRVFLEEAAGVSRYQARRKETLNHLEHTRTNLARLKDIAEELEGQMRTLKRQSALAIKYKEYGEQHKTAQIQLWSLQASVAEQAITVIDRQLEQLNEAYRQLRDTRVGVEQEEEQIQSELNQRLQDAAPVQQAWQQAQQAVYEAQQRLAMLKQQTEQAQREAQRLQDDMQALDETVQDDAACIADSERQKNELTPLMQVLQQEQQELREKRQQAEHAWVKANEAFTEAKHAVALQSVEKERVQQSIEQVTRALERLTQQIRHIEYQQQHQQDDVSERIVMLHADIEDDHLEHAVLSKQLTELQAKRHVFAQQATESAHRCMQYKQQHDQLLAEKDTLVRITGHRVLPVLDKNTSKTAVELPQTRLIDVLALTPAGQQHADFIESILSDCLQWPICRRVDALAGSALYLSHEQASNDSVELAITAFQPTVNGAITPLSDWIAEPILPWFSQVYIAPTRVDAVQWLAQVSVGQVYAVYTQDGYRIDHYMQHDLNADATPKHAGVLLALTRLQQMDAVLETALTHYTEAEQAQQLAKEALQQSDEQLTALQQAHVRLDAELKSKTQHLARLEVELAQQQRVQAQWATQLEELLSLHAEEEQALQDAQLEYAMLEKKQKTTHDLTVFEQQLQQAQTLRATYEEQTTLLLKRINDVSVNLTRYENELTYTRERQLKNEYKMTELRRQRLMLGEQLRLTQHELPMLEDAVLEANETLLLKERTWSKAQARVQELTHLQQALTLKRLESVDAEEKIRDALEKERLKWQEQDIKRTALQEQLATVEATVQLALLSELGDITQAQKIEQDLAAKIDDLQHKMQRMGELNLAAPHALEEVTERFDVLNHQMQDLESAIAQLEAAIATIDAETRHLFMETFVRINQELGVLFPKVFGGGRAELLLEEDWQSGIRLMAQPPGKKNSSITLLSGGEKTLTALALVFAIFTLNPAPFCVLDEVDAPLDDANVERYCALVRGLSDQVQFIYITHNKVAMTMANDLLGVTMPEAGVSKVVGVSIDEAAQYIMQ